MGNLPVSSVAKRAPVGCCRRRFRATPSIQPRSRRELGLFAARRSGGEGLTTRQARSPSPLRLKTAGRHRSAGTDRQRARALHAEDAVSRRHHARDFRTGGLHRATRCAGAEAPRAPDPQIVPSARAIDCYLLGIFFGVGTRWTRPCLPLCRSFNWATISSTSPVTTVRFPCR
jgi:hypothetical protein